MNEPNAKLIIGLGNNHITFGHPLDIEAVANQMVGLSAFQRAQMQSGTNIAKKQFVGTFIQLKMGKSFNKKIWKNLKPINGTPVMNLRKLTVLGHVHNADCAYIQQIGNPANFLPTISLGLWTPQSHTDLMGVCPLCSNPSGHIVASVFHKTDFTRVHNECDAVIVQVELLVAARLPNNFGALQKY